MRKDIERALIIWRETMAGYCHQQELTKRLDKLADEPLDRRTINEVVLWKVNRYVDIAPSLMEGIEALRGLRRGQHREAQSVLEQLLDTHGADLPMASTILRFRNPQALQIIDRHAYRALYEQKLPINCASSHRAKISTYFKYMDEIVEKSERFGVPFDLMDRVLYQADKDTREPLCPLPVDRPCGSMCGGRPRISAGRRNGPACRPGCSGSRCRGSRMAPAWVSRVAVLKRDASIHQPPGGWTAAAIASPKPSPSSSGDVPQKRGVARPDGWCHAWGPLGTACRAPTTAVPQMIASPGDSHRPSSSEGFA